jgi:hypothetical protein
MLGTVISDVYRQTEFGNLARGWSRVITFAAYFIVLRTLIGDRLHRVAYWAIGYGLGAILRFVLYSDDYFETNPFKFGLGLAVYDIILVVVPVLVPVVIRSVVVNTAFLLGLGAYALYSDYRSMFLMLVATAVISGIWIVLTRLQVRRLSAPFLIVVAVVAGSALYGAKLSYEHLASTGTLGPEMQEKYEMQSSADTNILFAGRTELFVSWEAIKDSPIIGRGSWAADPYYVQLRRARLESAGFTSGALADFEEERYGTLIPAHSVFFSTWIEAGILGVPFWVTILVLAGRFLYNMPRLNTILINLFVLNIIHLIWDVLFSPLSTTFRILGPMSICVMCCLLEQIREADGRASVARPPSGAGTWSAASRAAEPLKAGA